MRRLLQRRPFLATLPCVGVTVSDVFVAVCVRGSPVRVTGIYRCRLDPLGAAGRREALSEAAEEARHVLRTQAGTPAVLALSPVAKTVRLPMTNGWGRQAVAVAADQEAVAGLEDAGFAFERFDAIPAALARFAWGSNRPRGESAWVGGWTVSMSAEVFHAAAGRPLPTPDEAANGLVRAVRDLNGIGCPQAVRRHLNIQVDAGAIGAGLRGFGLDPDLLVDPLDQSPVVVPATSPPVLAPRDSRPVRLLRPT